MCNLDLQGQGEYSGFRTEEGAGGAMLAPSPEEHEGEQGSPPSAWLLPGEEVANPEFLCIISSDTV